MVFCFFFKLKFIFILILCIIFYDNPIFLLTCTNFCSRFFYNSFCSEFLCFTLLLKSLLLLSIFMLLFLQNILNPKSVVFNELVKIKYSPKFCLFVNIFCTFAFCEHRKIVIFFNKIRKINQKLIKTSFLSLWTVLNIVEEICLR